MSQITHCYTLNPFIHVLLTVSSFLRIHTLQYLTCYPDLLCNKKAKYSSQHLKWIKKVNQICPKTRTHFGFRFRTTLMKCFDPLQMLTSIYSLFICIPHVFFKGAVCTVFTTMHKNTIICLQIFRKHAKCTYLFLRKTM